MLEDRNHQVTLVTDGEQCIATFEKEFHAMQKTGVSKEDHTPYDILVLDFRMPKKDGVDVAKHVLSICPIQKIIFATAYTMESLGAIMKEIGMGVEVLQKPFDLDAFVEMVEDLGQRPIVAKKRANSKSNTHA